MLRAVRLAAKLGCEIEPKTAAPIQRSFSEAWSPASAAWTTNRSNAWLRLLLRK